MFRALALRQSEGLTLSWYTSLSSAAPTQLPSSLKSWHYTGQYLRCCGRNTSCTPARGVAPTTTAPKSIFNTEFRQSFSRKRTVKYHDEQHTTDQRTNEPGYTRTNEAFSQTECAKITQPIRIGTVWNLTDRPPNHSTITITCLAKETVWGCRLDFVLLQFFFYDLTMANNSLRSE